MKWDSIIYYCSRGSTGFMGDTATGLLSVAVMLSVRSFYSIESSHASPSRHFLLGERPESHRAQGRDNCPLPHPTNGTQIVFLYCGGGCECPPASPCAAAPDEASTERNTSREYLIPSIKTKGLREDRGSRKAECSSYNGFLQC